uniref:Uncharacterized protein n=1 Tax=Mola mola TaxID=94237 RepID=A0A3Q3VR36_MOLML
ITREASFRARDAFISPSAAITCTRDSNKIRTATISNLNTYSSENIYFTSLISTRSTLMPQLSVKEEQHLKSTFLITYLLLI